MVASKTTTKCCQRQQTDNMIHVSTLEQIKSHCPEASEDWDNHQPPLLWDTTLKTPHLPSVTPGPRLNKNVSVKLLAKLHFFHLKKKCIIYMCISKCLCECMCTGVRGCTHLCKGVEGRRGCWMPSSSTLLLFVLSRASP